MNARYQERTFKRLSNRRRENNGSSNQVIATERAFPDKGLPGSGQVVDPALPLRPGSKPDEEIKNACQYGHLKSVKRTDGAIANTLYHTTGEDDTEVYSGITSYSDMNQYML